jgi:hypothetical protein
VAEVFAVIGALLRGSVTVPNSTTSPDSCLNPESPQNTEKTS